MVFGGFWCRFSGCRLFLVGFFEGFLLGFSAAGGVFFEKTKLIQQKLKGTPKEANTPLLRFSTPMHQSNLVSALSRENNFPK